MKYLTILLAIALIGLLIHLIDMQAEINRLETSFDNKAYEFSECKALLRVHGVNYSGIEL